MDWMLTAGGRRSGKPGTGLSGRTARLTLGRLSAALEMAVLEGKLVRDVARLVKPPEHTQRERETWRNAEVRKSSACEVGYRVMAKTLTVSQARVLVEYRVRIEDPKSRNGKRTLPLDDKLVAALTALRKRQLAESSTAGLTYQLGLAVLGWYQGGEYVITDEVGMPVHPE